MKKIILSVFLILFTTSLYASSCMTMAAKIDEKIEEAQALRDQAMKAHELGDHAKSDDLFAKAMQLFKNQ
tara:strand:+ start:281 stop:490 length:210 start_codon:yes stop_codon:yes gene_type:complete